MSGNYLIEQNKLKACMNSGLYGHNEIVSRFEQLNMVVHKSNNLPPEKKVLTSAEVEQYNLELKRSSELLCNLHAQPFEKTLNFGKRKRTAPGDTASSADVEIDSFDLRTAAIALILLLPAFFSLTFGAYEMFAACHFDLAALFATLMVSAIVAFVARGGSTPRLDYEVNSYFVAFLFCLPAWVFLYLLFVAFSPVHTAMGLASLIATAANIYFGGPFGEKKRRATANVIAFPSRGRLGRRAERTKGASLSMQRLKVDYMACKPVAICRYYQLFFTKSALAKLFEHSLKFAYAQKDRELVIDADAPGLDIFPVHRGAKYNKTADKVQFIDQTEQARNNQYREFLSSWALRMAADALVADRAGALNSVIFNAYAPLVVPATGKVERSCLLSLRLSKADLAELDIAHVDKMACLRRLGARLGGSSGGIVSIEPLRTTNNAECDSSQALLSTDPLQFEYLLADLLRKMGLEATLTKASHDGGVDIIAYDRRPILGGKIVVQAKRYKHTVPVSAVRDLYGTMQHEGASKAILFTTSKLSADAWQFADGKPMQLIEGDKLVQLLSSQGIAAHL